MATITSLGLGSGLDVDNIISKLVALEKKPLETLATQATLITSKVSAYGQIRSLATSVADAAAALGKAETWSAMSVGSSDSASVSVSTTATAAQAGSYSIAVQQLAREQSAASASMAADGQLGSGKLHIQLGTWSGPSGSMSFAAGSGAAVDITIDAAESSVSQIAAKINEAQAGVTATVITDATGQRLMLRSSATGQAAGFRIQASDASGQPDTSGTGLSQLAFDPQNHPTLGMAANTTEYAQDAMATLNGLSIRSKTNSFADTVPGLTLQVNKVTTTPVTVTMTQNMASMKTSVQSFVTAYNAYNNYLSSLTKYDSATKTAAALQGDSTANRLLASMRTAVTGAVDTAGSLNSLSAMGISLGADGALTLDSTKFDKAMTTHGVAGFKTFFAGATVAKADTSFSGKLGSFISGLTADDGLIDLRTDALAQERTSNGKAQEKVNANATAMQARLEKSYAALDTKMATLNALNTYMTQQITQWNKDSD